MNTHAPANTPDKAELENQLCRVKYATRLVVLARDNACDDIGGNALHIAIDLMEREAEAASEIFYQVMYPGGRSA
ncbi:hypothetical protein KHC28_24205 [Ancylobacter sonchi]|uniref:hypothetical protein n=1 Tax=Ancylobacter sonchi TaxID=1937790 RepID=UPI001BD60BC7|nr:hypothetical protein [Ancylobacter sonchi]MBS7536752.1 hypothetical protein [Ancylobacter sonchi]